MGEVGDQGIISHLILCCINHLLLDINVIPVIAIGGIIIEINSRPYISDIPYPAKGDVFGIGHECRISIVLPLVFIYDPFQFALKVDLTPFEMRDINIGDIIGNDLPPQRFRIQRTLEEIIGFHQSAVLKHNVST